MKSIKIEMIFLSILVLFLLTCCGQSPENLAAGTRQAGTATATLWTLTPTSTIPAASSATPVPSPTPDLIPMLRLQLEGLLKQSPEVKEIQQLDLNPDGMNLVLTSGYITKDLQAALAYDFLSQTSSFLGLLPKSTLESAFNLETFRINLVIHSADNQYHFYSLTDFKTLEAITKEGLSKDDWLKAANGHYEFE